MTRYDPSLVDLTSNFFVLCTNVEVYLYNYSEWVELSMNIHEGKGLKCSGTPLECQTVWVWIRSGILLGLMQILDGA